MKPIRKYFFGYLFVRFAKLFALLTVLAGIGSILTTSAAYFTDSSAARYVRNGDLDSLLSRLANELDFALTEVGKISDTSDLKPLALPSAPEKDDEFKKLDDALATARDRNSELKQRVVREFELQTGAILAQIDQFLASNAPEPVPQNDKTKQPSPIPVAPKVEKAMRMLFEETRTDYSLNAMTQIEKSLLGLEEQAENPQNKKALMEAAAEVERLSAWLPKQLDSSNPSQILMPESEEQEESVRLPESPFVQAELNRRRLAAIIQEVRQLTTSDWILDDLVASAVRSTEQERRSYEASKVAQRGLRIAWLGKIGISLFFTLAGAFAVLVVADWLQSFFDTASSAIAINEKMTTTP